MEIINYKTQCIAIITLVVLMMGCQSDPQKKIVTNHADMTVTPTELQINYEALKHIEVAMSNLGYNGDQLAQSASQSSTNAAMQPGADPAAGLVGAFIGIGIVQSSAQSLAQKHKNAPVGKFLQNLESLNWVDVFKSSKLSEKYSIISPPYVTKTDRKLFLVPSVEVSADYRSLNLNAEVSLRGKNNKILYKNFFHIQSESLLKGEEILGVLNEKTQQDLVVVLHELIAYLPDLIESDINGWPNKNLTTSTSIKFDSSSGQYFERGYVLEVRKNTIIFKSLRGEVKQVPFTKML